MASTAAVAAMAKRLPPGYVDLQTAMLQKEGSLLNVMGVVGDWMPPAPCGGSDFQMTFTLNDTKIFLNGFRVKFFRNKERELPPIKSSGDVVLLRNIKVSVDVRLALIYDN